MNIRRTAVYIYGPGGLFRRAKTAIAVLLTSTLFFYCTNPTVAGGTDVGNPEKSVLTGTIVDTTGALQSHTRVVLYKSSYNPLTDDPVAARVDTTDSAGIYHFSHLVPDTFTLYALHLSKRTRRIVPALIVSKSETVVREADTITAPQTLIIRIPRDAVASASHVFIPGTSISAPVDTGGVVVIDSVPQGSDTFFLFSAQGDTIVHIDSSLEVVPVQDSGISDTIGQISPRDTVIRVPFNEFRSYDVTTDCTGVVWSIFRDGRIVTFSPEWEEFILDTPLVNAYAITTARDGAIWIAASPWVYTIRDDTTERTYLDMGANAIGAATDSSIWVTSSGISRYKNGVWSSYFIDRQEHHPIREMWQHPDGSYWFNCESGLLHYQNQLWTQIDQNVGAPAHDAEIQGILTDGTMWADVYPKEDSTWYYFDGTTWTPFSVNDSTPWFGRVREVDQHPSGEIWVVGNNGIFSYKNSKWYSHNPDQRDSISSAVAVTFDRSGRVWISQLAGVSMYDGQRWTTYRQ